MSMSVRWLDSFHEVEDGMWHSVSRTPTALLHKTDIIDSFLNLLLCSIRYNKIIIYIYQYAWLVAVFKIGTLFFR